MNARDITEKLQVFDLNLARVCGADPETIAGCHLGLGIVMLRELHWSIEDLVALVRSVAEQHVARGAQ